MAIGKHGPVTGLYVLGPGCRPNWWEHTAVPELRAHACALAAEFTAVTLASPWIGAPPRGERITAPQWSSQR